MRSGFLASLILGLFALLRPGNAIGQQRAPSCPEGERPRFTGEILDPLRCAKPASPEAADGAGRAPAIPAKASRATQIKDLVGRWQGMAVAGISRYEVLLDIRMGQDGVYVVRLATKDYAFHRRNAIWGRLQPTDTAGQFRTDVWLDSVPELGLDGWLQLKPLDSQDQAGQTHDRQAQVTFDLRSGLQEVWFKVTDTETLSYSYRMTGFPRPLSFSGELKKTELAELP